MDAARTGGLISWRGRRRTEDEEDADDVDEVIEDNSLVEQVRRRRLDMLDCELNTLIQRIS